jgi:hypothetical protein
VGASSNPSYNYALGAINQSGVPPFDLSQVVMRVFPLRANYHSLQLFCDRFINIAPEYSHFEPAAPYVLFCVINYGHMGNVASNLGYTSQNEVLFAVPLNWYRQERGRWALQPRASISPFIWVDRPSSAWTGRNVFGWPKSVAWLTPGLSEWTKDPTAPRTLFTLSALMYQRLFAGQRQEPGILLEVEHEQPSSLFDVPPNPMNPLNPWLSWPKGVLRSLGVGGSLLQTMTRLPTFGFPPWGEGANIVEMMASAFGDFDPVGSLPASNTINLKQFRQPSHPQSISYQAIVNSQMTPKSFSRGGMLGEAGLLRGDLAGGYRIRVHRRPAWPIIESLGLEVSHEARHEDHDVATLEPVLPFWVDVDFQYGKGEVICWRTRGSHWTPPPDADDAPALKLTPPGERLQNEFQCEDCGSPHLYNTAEGSAVQQVYGPFEFPNATVRVLPLMADWNKLRRFTDAYLNFPATDEPPSEERQTQVHSDEWLKIWPSEEDRWPKGSKKPTDVPAYLHGLPMTGPTASGNLFIPWGRYVYMTVTSYEEIASELNIGWWARRRVTFSYPVKWYQWTEKDPDGHDVSIKAPGRSRGKDREITGYWALKSFGVVSPFMYVDTTTAATVGREMQGWTVAEAEIECPPTEWLLDASGTHGTNLLSLRTDVMAALNANQQTEQELLVEVTSRDPVPRTDEEAWREIAAKWGERQVVEAEAKAREAFQTPAHDWDPRRRLTWLKSTAMEVLFRGAPINHIALKQFRDAEDPNEACLQALNIYPEEIDRIHDLRPIDDTLHVAVHRYPTAPIVELFGLDVKWTDTGRGQPIDYLQVIRPFWMRADVKAHLGRDVVWRAASNEWREGDHSPLYFDLGEEGAAPANAAGYADEHPRMVQGFGSRVGREHSVRKAVAEFGTSSWSHTRGGHLAQLKESRISFSPQTAIESILNHGWVNFDPDPSYPLNAILLNPGSEEARWATLIPRGSIRHSEAVYQFLRDYGSEVTDRGEGGEGPVEDEQVGPYWSVPPESE